MEKTSLEKSHSKASNAKLTLLCFVSSIFASLTVAFISLFDMQMNTAGYFFLGGAIASLLISILCVMGLNKFTR